MTFEEIYKTYWDKIFRLCLGYSNNHDAAKDLAQETFLKVYIKKDSYREISKFSTWLYTIASNLAKTELRKIKRRKTFSISSITNSDKEHNYFIDDDTNKEKVLDNNENNILHQSLYSLEQDFRTIIILREIQELSYDNISKILKLPLGTVKSRINRGKLKLREVLIDKGVKKI